MARLKKGDRVRVKSGPDAGKTGKLGRLHGGKGWAGVWLVWIDGTAWNAPSLGVHCDNLEPVA